jgi:hypothetical protein
MKEADRAYQLKKLIPLKSKDLKIDSVPFRDGVIVRDLDEYAKLFEALYKKRVYPKGVLARFAMGLRHEVPGGGTIVLMLIAVAVLIFEGVFRGMGEDLWSVIKPLLASFVRW